MTYVAVSLPSFVPWHTLLPQASTTIDFDLTARHLALADRGGSLGLHPGEFEVVFSRGHGAELTAPVVVSADRPPLVLREFRRWW